MSSDQVVVRVMYCGYVEEIAYKKPPLMVTELRSKSRGSRAITLCFGHGTTAWHGARGDVMPSSISRG